MQGVGDPEGGFLQRVARRCDALGNTPRIVNKGIGGETTRDMLRRVSELASYRPYSLVVQLGCNDFPREGDPSPASRTEKAEYLENVREMLTAIRGSHSLFISSFLVSEERSGISAATFDDRMPAAMETARTLGYDVWDLYAETRTGVADYLAADGKHFNAAGHEMIARYIYRWLASNVSGGTA